MERREFLLAAGAAGTLLFAGEASAAEIDDLAKRVDAEAKARAARDEFSGVVMLADGHKPVFSAGYGLASREYNVPNRPDTAFNIASIGKVFTASAVMALVGSGKLTLDDTVGKHLPAYPNADARQKVTIRQLLLMSSGIGDVFNDRFEATDKGKLRSNAAYLPLFADMPLEFAPGTSQKYSNGGFIVLGEIVAAASGQPFERFVQTAVFDAAGMAHSGYFARDDVRPNVAQGYLRNPRRSNIYDSPAAGSAAGGVYSTAPDLVAYARALDNATLALPKEMRGGPPPIGLGVAGGAPGINTTFDTNLKGRYDAIVLANDDPPAAMELARFIRATIGAGG